MASILKKLLIINIFFVLSFLCIPKAFASGEFTEKNEVTYTVNDNGVTQVRHDIQITNLQAEYYTNKYSLGIGNQKIKNLKASDKSGIIKTRLTQEASGSSVNLEFADQKVGKNAKRNFIIEYETSSITQKLGSAWVLTLPKVLSSDLNEYLATISVPDSFGSISSQYPTPSSLEKKDNRTFYHFSTAQMTTSEVSMNFGDRQTYTLGLTYHLNNSKNNSVYTQIALPMNTEHQTIVYDSLTPTPQSIEADLDGNYIAKYTLKPKQSIQVQVIAKAIVYLDRQSPKEKLSSADKLLFTRDQPFWESSNPKIISLARSLNTPENIYRYVVDKLTYNSSKVNNNFDRHGALKILDEPQNSVCMEFTDLFIALARASGIPAREINGYAYTDDSHLRPASLSQDTLHAWPEYYDEQKGWVQIDPTWENTTKGVDYFNSFDLNHIAFVRKGQSSTTPYPAGAYKGEDPDTRDVVVSFANQEPSIKNASELLLELPQSVLASADLSWNIKVKNTGNVGLSQAITEQTHFKDENSTETIPVTVPPFSTITLRRHGKKTVPSDDADFSVTVKSLAGTATKTSKVVPFYKHSVTLFGLSYLIGVPLVAFFSYKVLHKDK